jgi:signal transduction histidine kinase/methyl-accepting chemotaxis protein
MSITTGVVVFVGFIVSSVNIFNSVFDDLHKERSLAIIHSFDAGITIGDLKEGEKMQSLINKFIYLSPDIEQLSISVADEDNVLHIRASNMVDLIGEKTNGNNNEVYISEKIVHAKTVLKNGDLGVKVVSPVILGGKKMGTYEMYLSTQESWILFRNKMIVFLSIISVFVILASIMFYGVVRKSIVLPILKLVKAVSQRGDGDFDYQIEVKSKDEIGELERAFNETGLRLADLYKNLEKKVAERTEELNEGLKKIEEQNLVLEDNKLAMINILEDDKKLEEALKAEKEGVEKKIIERTLELSNTKAKLDSSIENLPLGFLMIDVEENLVIDNSLAKEILGGKDEKSNFAILKKILKGKVDLKEYIKNCGLDKKRLVFSDIEIKGRYFQFLLSPILTKEKEEICIGIVVLVQDITEAKILERSKDEFFSIASHELRTPLTAIRGNTSMILEYYAEAVKDPELKMMVDDIHESSIRLINIVNDFLNVSRLEQRRMEFKIEKFDISKLVPETIKEYDVTGSRKKIGIEYVTPDSPLPLVSGEMDKVRQVLINLLGNSLKFTAEGGIKIKTEISGKFVKVLVSDTGRGIPLKQQSLLFHKFQQTGESLFTRDTAGGSGLGLYISKMMIEGMGGEIKLEKSEEGKGSTFSFSLPIAKK